MEREEWKKKEGEVRSEPQGCGCWRAEGSMNDHQPLGFLQPPADSLTNSLLPIMLSYNVICRFSVKPCSSSAFVVFPSMFQQLWQFSDQHSVKLCEQLFASSIEFGIETEFLCSCSQIVCFYTEKFPIFFHERPTLHMFIIHSCPTSTGKKNRKYSPCHKIFPQFYCFEEIFITSAIV